MHPAKPSPENPTDQPPTGDPATARWWAAMAVAVVLAVIGVMVSWGTQHPYATNWDESTYLNQIHRDAQAFDDTGTVGLARALRGQKRFAPPAYRLLALPVSLTLGPRTLPLRLASLGVFLLALFLVHRTAARVGGEAAGWLATAMVATSPDLVRTNLRIYTEPSLVLAVAGSVYFLARLATRAPRPQLATLGLGVSLALGVLAKMTFPPILAPVMAVAVIAAWRGRLGGATLGRLATAVAFSLLLAGPIYFSNLRNYLSYAFGAGANVPIRGETYLGQVANWMELYAASAFGPAGTWILFVIACAALWRLRPGAPERLSASERHLLVAAILATLPLLCLQLFWTRNADVRIMAPTYLPTAVAAAVIASRLGLLGRRAAIAAGALLMLQVGLLAWPLLPSPQAPQISREHPMLERPLYATRSSPQWDWERLTEVLPAAAWTSHPQVVYLGYEAMLNKHQIAYPWERRGERVTVRPLFEPQRGEDWDTAEIRRQLDLADVAITVPSYEGPFASRNLRNADLAPLLATDPRFAGPRTLSLGRTSETFDVLVWWRADLSNREPMARAPKPAPILLTLAIWGYLALIAATTVWIARPRASLSA